MKDVKSRHMQLNAKGISLVEVMISALLLSMVLISLTKIYYYAQSQINISRPKTLAINLIQANLVGMPSTGYPGTTTGSYPLTQTGSIDSGDVVVVSDHLNGSMTTHIVDLNTNKGYKFIVTTTWDEPYGIPDRTLTETAELLVTNYE